MKRSANSSLEHVIRNRCRPSTHPDVTRMHCELRRGRVTSIERDVMVISSKKEQRSHGYISIRRENQFREIDVPRADETLCKIDTMLYICRSIRHPKRTIYLWNSMCDICVTDAHERGRKCRQSPIRHGRSVNASTPDLSCFLFLL